MPFRSSLLFHSLGPLYPVPSSAADSCKSCLLPNDWGWGGGVSGQGPACSVSLLAPTQFLLGLLQQHQWDTPIS